MKLFHLLAAKILTALYLFFVAGIFTWVPWRHLGQPVYSWIWAPNGLHLIDFGRIVGHLIAPTALYVGLLFVLNIFAMLSGQTKAQAANQPQPERHFAVHGGLQ